MAVAAYERLSAQDRTFLWFENAGSHIHLGGLVLFEPGPLAGPDGGLDIERIRAHIAARLHLAPRYRQRLGWVPVVNRPVWVDDAHFNLSYHVRHTALPRPGDDAQLKRLTGRIMSQQLDRGKPLWELWIIEGLRDGRFAILVKTHHALADGISAFDLFAALLAPEPTDAVDPPQPWIPRPPPSSWRMLRDQVSFYATAPLDLATGFARELGNPARLRETVGRNLRAVWELAGVGLRRPPSTPLNRPIGSHRRFDWLTTDLGAVKTIRQRLGGTVNDVVLATVAGAVRRFLIHRGAAVDGVDYKVVVPVSLRTEDERGVINNRASGWLAPLPVNEPDPRRRLAMVCGTTQRLKASRQELGPDVLGRIAEYAPPGMLQLGVLLASRLQPYNLIVTNVPGPPVPLYLLGARLVGGYPQVPLFENQGLGIALFSYCGQLNWGFNADWDLVPDLDVFVKATETAFEELRQAADAG